MIAMSSHAITRKHFSRMPTNHFPTVHVVTVECRVPSQFRLHYHYTKGSDPKVRKNHLCHYNCHKVSVARDGWMSTPLNISPNRTYPPQSLEIFPIPPPCGHIPLPRRDLVPEIPTRHGQTNTCENITFSKLRWRPVNVYLLFRSSTPVIEMYVLFRMSTPIIGMHLLFRVGASVIY